MSVEDDKENKLENVTVTKHLEDDPQKFNDLHPNLENHDDNIVKSGDGVNNFKDDDDGDVDLSDSLANTASADDMLESSIRFSVAETNSIREALGLNAISIDDEDDDGTIDEDDSGAIDAEEYDDDEEDDDDDDDEDQIEMLNSYAEILDDTDDGDLGDEIGETSLGTNLLGDAKNNESSFEFSSNSHGNSSSQKDVGVDEKTSTRSSLLSATLLLLQNLSAQELAEVEKECSKLKQIVSVKCILE